MSSDYPRAGEQFTMLFWSAGFDSSRDIAGIILKPASWTIASNLEAHRAVEQLAGRVDV